MHYSYQILMKLEFYRQIFEKSANIKFKKIRPVTAGLFHAEGWRDITKLTVALRNFANTLKKAENTTGQEGIE
jgi:hypothetical protein